MHRVMSRGGHHAERGQTLPIWIGGIVAGLVLLWFTLDYASTIRWQVRAQNAADAAAASLLSVQTTRFNQMEMTLYALSLDEWRIRNLVESMVLVVQGGGGCQNQTPAWTAGKATSACGVAYTALRNAYVAALYRYTQEAQALQTIQQYATIANETTEINAIIAAQNGGTLCGARNGWDCGFTYALAPNGQLQTRTQVWNIDQFFGGTTGYYGYIQWQPGTVATVNQNLLPARLEVVACAKVTPPIASFFQLHAQTFLAIGRAGATTVAATSEWLIPGAFAFAANDPKYPNQVIQPPETYGLTYPDAYTTSFTGNTYVANTATNSFSGYISLQEYSAYLSWWAPIPFPPSGVYVPATANCKTVE
jgi:hypothetical protein